jgi:broad specificity phosphatase PhoE
MADVMDIAPPQAPPQDPGIGNGTPPQQPPPKLSLSDQDRQKLDSIVSKMVANKEKDEDIQAVVNDFKQKYAGRQTSQNGAASPGSVTPSAGNQTPQAPPDATPATAPLPEHQISHTPVQDIRHLNDLSNQPVRNTVSSAGEGAPGIMTPNPDDVARNKGYRDQYQKAISDQATAWGTDPKATQKALEDFPGEMDENKIKQFATLNQQNPVYYGRLKSADQIRQAVAGSGDPDAIADAKALNTVFAPKQTDTYETLQNDVAMAQEIMTKHGLSTQNYHEMLKTVYAPMINTLQPGLLSQYWDSDDKKLGLSDFQYAGLETEKMFNPGKYQQDMAIIKHNRGLDESSSEPTPIPQGKEGYAYDRGVENVLFALENQGRQNTGQYISQRRAELGPQIDDMVKGYKDAISFETQPAAQQALQAQFLADPIHQEAAKLDEGQQSIEYAQTEDQRKFPLNYSDRATREVKDAMSHLNGVQGAANTESAVVRTMFQGAGEQADNTMRFIKNTWINMLGSDQWKAENAASNIGHQALTDLSGYQGDAFSTHQNATVIDPELQSNVQKVFEDQSLDYEDKVKKATDLIVSNPDQIKANPLAGQQNLTGKAIIYTAANTVGQILGIADQSLLMGGLLGDASKAQQMANAFVPMYASTQNSLYEQALARGDEKPLLSSHLDAAIISLASMINPDVKVVKGMLGAETGVGKMIAGVEEDTWNKVLSTNKPLMDRMKAGTIATAKQLGLANLQYGLIVPTAQYVVHKNVLNEDPNLGDAIKDGLLQTSISMALPALMHGAFGGINATEVNPMQKYAMVELGLHPKENAELIDQAVEKGQITPDRASQIKDIIKHTGHILENTEGVKSDGTPMNEQEVADLAYQMVRKRVLEGKLKNAPDPQKPAIEQRINEIDQSVADLHTSEADKQKTALNQLLTSNIDRIKANIPTMEGQVREAIKRNEPEQVFQEIHDQATQTTNVDGKEISSRSKTEDIFGKELVDKAFDLHNNKKPDNGKGNKNAGRPDQTQEVKPPVTQQAPEGAAPETTGTANAAPSFIHPTDQFRTWNLGDMEGKPEDEAAKKHLEGVVQKWDQHPAGETGGEPFGDFVNRVIPAFDKVLKDEPNNTTIVTHSSVLKAMRVWDEMGRPDVEHLTEEQKKEFATKYNETETHNGDLETFKGSQGDVHVIRHGQTVDNEKNNFRSGDTPLTQKGIGDARAVGQELKAKTGGYVPQIITSDLPRTIRSSNIISDALRESSPTGEVPRAGTAGEDIPVSGEGVGQGQQGEETPGQSGGTGEGQEPPGGAGGETVSASAAERGRNVGPSHDALTELALRLGLKEPERGKTLTPAEYAERGRKLIEAGADPEKVARTFQRTGKGNADMIAVARAHLENLVADADKIGDVVGTDKEGYKKALEAIQKWQDEVLKPMATELFGATGNALQGTTDLDTGSFTNLARNFYELHKRELTEKQAATIKELTTTVREKDETIADLTKKMSKVHDDGTALQQNKKATPQLAKKADALAQKLRDNAKIHRPGSFSAATPASLVWDASVEVVAKAIQAGGRIGDAIAKGIDVVRQSDWYKGLTDPEKKKAEDEFVNWHTEQADKKAAARIKALEKQLADLQAGKVKSKTQNFETDREKELKDQIFEQKNKMGLIAAKATPQPKVQIPKAPQIPQQTIAEKMVNKQGNNFSPEDARDIWGHVKENYLDKGVMLSDALRGTSTDLGLTADQILHAIATPKGGRELTAELFKQQNERNKASEYARRYVETANEPAAVKFFNNLPQQAFNLKTYGHGTVGNITHAATNIFRPSVWSAYWPNVIKSFQLAYGSTAGYEKAITLLENRPNFDAWNQAGLAIDPREAYDDYQVFGRAPATTQFGKAVRYLGEAGTKGFTGLKLMRYDLAEKWYNQASDTERADPNFREEIAKLANHATGHSEVQVGKVLKAITFAPGLEVSRWQRMIGDPYKAAKTFATWDKSTAAEQAAAKIVASGAGQRLAIYGAALLANAGLLAALGSKQKINVTDPSHSDWLKFKFNNKTLDVTGGVLGPLRLLHTIGTLAYNANLGEKKDNKMKPDDKDAQLLWRQLRYKAAPLPGDVLEAATGQDAMGNTLPWSKVPPAKGRKQLTVMDYGRDLLLPIPVAAGFNAYYDAMEKQGVPPNKIKAIWDGSITGLIEGFAGAKYEPDYSLEQEKPAGRRGR